MIYIKIYQQKMCSFTFLSIPLLDKKIKQHLDSIQI